MANPLRKLRMSVNTFFILVMALIGIGYVVIHANLVGRVTNTYMSTLLSQYLETEVEVGDVEVKGLNTAGMGPVIIYDQAGDTLLYARRIHVSYELWPLLMRKLKVNSILLVDFEINGSQSSIHDKPNFQFLLDALTPREKSKSNLISAFDINGIYLRKGCIRFDVRDVRHSAPGLFDIHHVCISDLSAHMNLSYSPVSGATLDVRRMSLREQSGLNIQSAMLHLLLGDEEITLQGVQINSGASLFSLNKVNFVSNPLLTLRKYGADQWLCDVQGLYCQLHPTDLGHIDTRLSDLPNPVNLSGSMHATSDTIRLSQWHLYDTDSLLLHGEMIVTCQDTSSQLKWLQQRQVTLDLQHLYLPQTATNVLTSFIPHLKPLQRRLLRDGLGCIDFAGTASANRLHIEADGTLQTLGQWESAPLRTSLHIAAGYRPETRQFQLQADGSIPTVSHNGYTYHDIRVDAHTDGRTHSVRVSLDDPYLTLDADAVLSTGAVPSLELQAHVGHFSPYALALHDDAVLDGLSFSFDADGALEGGALSELAGVMDIRDIFLQRGDTTEVVLAPIHLERHIDGGDSHGYIRSDFLDLLYRSSATEGHRFQGSLSPTLALSDILLLDMDFRQPTDFSFCLDTLLTPREANVQIHELVLPSGTLQANVGLSPVPDDPAHLNAQLSADLLSPKHQMSAVVQAQVGEDMSSLAVTNGVVSIDNIDFHLNEGQIISDSGRVLIDNLVLQNEAQRLQADGIIGKGEPGLLFSLENLQIRPILALLGHGYLDFGGCATGGIRLTTQGNPTLRTEDLQIEDFSYIGTTIGHSDFEASFDLARNLLDLDVHFLTADQRSNHASGFVQLAKRDSMDLQFDLDRLPIDFISYWVGNILHDLHGFGTGKVHLYGLCKKPDISGDPTAQLAFTHSFLGTPFQIDDVIHLEAHETGDSHIRLDRAQLSDGKGHQLSLTADILHDHLSHFRYDVHADIPETPHGFLVYNHPRQVNGAYYWGQIYATGNARLYGGDGVHHIDVDVRTADHSTFFLSPGEDHPAEDNGKYQLLTYRESPRAGSDPLGQQRLDTYDDVSPLNLFINLNVEATEKCQVMVQMDPLSEDRLKTLGHGNLFIQYDPRQDLRVNGLYNMSSGSYTMTMSGDLFTKEFQLQPTSNVRFSGPPSQAELNWDCRYYVPNVNITDLDRSFASLSSMSSTTVPVDCKMMVTGPMSQPMVTFDLEVRGKSDDVQALIHNIIGTPEMLNQQVFYVLLFQRFFTPSYAQAQENHTGSELSSFASSSLTSQLNSLLSRVNDNVSLGTNVRTEKGDFSDMEMDLSVSTRMFNDRLLLNGNLGYRDPSTRIGLNNNNTNSFIGDFDAEYLMNRRGTVRAKAYSHYNERDYSINNALTTQGLGIMWRKDFREFLDIFRRSTSVGENSGK